MAVYTQVSSEDIVSLLKRYDVGELTAFKGIAEGVENSNFLVETTTAHFILTLYENRVDPADLPYFHGMLAHLHHGGCKVPRFIEDASKQWLQEISGKKGCLIEFLTGVSVSHPNPEQAESVGKSLGEMHNALRDFSQTRPNPLGINEWSALFARCDREQSEELLSGISKTIENELGFLVANWPHHLPQSAVHTDLFPDNVLMLDNEVTGLIDFYFACSDISAYDIAVTHAAWSFSSDGALYDPYVGTALLNGYVSVRPISDEEREALPILARGASMRFLLTRLFDWINTPPEAMVTRKDPLAFLRRLDFYRKSGADIWSF
jgi:homoserine kinase type II